MRMSRTRGSTGLKKTATDPSAIGRPATGARLILAVMPAVPTTPAAPPVIRIQLFARYAELFGAQRLELPAEGITCVRDVLERLRALPGGAAIGTATLVAVNLRQAKPDAPVSPLDEVAVLPPLAGG